MPYILYSVGIYLLMLCKSYMVKNLCLLISNHETKLTYSAIVCKLYCMVYICSSPYK